MDYNLPERRRKTKILIISLVGALVAAVVVFLLLKLVLGGGKKKEAPVTNETNNASYYISDMRNPNYRREYNIKNHKLEFYYGYERTNYKYNIVVSILVDGNIIVFDNNRITVPIKKLEDDNLEDSIVESSLGTYLDWISNPIPAKSGNTEYFVVTFNTVEEENKAFLFDVNGELIDDEKEEVTVLADMGNGVQKIYSTKAYKNNAFKKIVSKVSSAYSGMQNLETGVLVKQEIALFNDGTYFEASDMNGKSASEGTYKIEKDKLYITKTREYGNDCCYYDVKNGGTTKFTYSNEKLIGILTLDNVNTAFVLPKTDANSLNEIKSYITANDRCYCGSK